MLTPTVVEITRLSAHRSVSTIGGWDSTHDRRSSAALGGGTHIALPQHDAVGEPDVAARRAGRRYSSSDLRSPRRPSLDQPESLRPLHPLGATVHAELAIDSAS
jgi:hypothetical protein